MRRCPQLAKNFDEVGRGVVFGTMVVVEMMMMMMIVVTMGMSDDEVDCADVGCDAGESDGGSNVVARSIACGMTICLLPALFRNTGEGEAGGHDPGRAAALWGGAALRHPFPPCLHEPQKGRSKSILYEREEIVAASGAAAFERKAFFFTILTVFKTEIGTSVGRFFAFLPVGRKWCRGEDLEV